MSKQYLQGEHRVYNIEIHDAHNYFVSEQSVLVHNTGICPGSKGSLTALGQKLGLSNLVGKFDLSDPYGVGTAVFDVDAILKNMSTSKNSAFKDLTSVFEQLAKESGLNEVQINFNLVVNSRLAWDESWAREYGCHFFQDKAADGTINVIWTKFLD